MGIHRVLEGDERNDVDGAWIWDVVVGGVQVDNGDGALDGGEQLVLSVAISRFAASWSAADDLTEWHGCGASQTQIGSVQPTMYWPSTTTQRKRRATVRHPVPRTDNYRHHSSGRRMVVNFLLSRTMKSLASVSTRPQDPCSVNGPFLGFLTVRWILLLQSTITQPKVRCSVHNSLSFWDTGTSTHGQIGTVMVIKHAIKVWSSALSSK